MATAQKVLLPLTTGRSFVILPSITSQKGNEKKEREDVWAICCIPTIEKIFFFLIFIFLFVLREKAHRPWCNSTYLDIRPTFRFLFLSSISSTTMTAFSLHSKHNCEHILLSLTSLLHIMGEKWIETLKALLLTTDRKTGDCPLVETADRSENRQKWREDLLKLKNPKGKLMFGAPTSLFYGFLFWKVLQYSSMLPLVTHTLE